MEQNISIGKIDLAAIAPDKEAELLSALLKRAEDRKNAGSEYVIVRSDKAGVFIGILHSLSGTTAVLNKCRRVWYWKGAASVSQLAKDGTDNKESKISVETDDHLVLGICEVVPCTKRASEKILSIKPWVA